ncbi:MAG TPA: lipopolysaccharide biosynthesis protein [Anaerolineales bacterium]|nr:lipopolysaccharide biosynthesis protein [Anaerolineales bacterium]
MLKNSSYLFGSNSISAVLSMVSTIFATRLLGIGGLGLVAIVQTFASNINRLLSFRMSEVVVKYLGQALASESKDAAEAMAEKISTRKSNPINLQAAAIVKGIGLIEVCTSTAAYLVLVLLATWAARLIAKDIATASFFSFYGLMLLGNLVYETSTGVLQAHKRFDRLAIINTIQSVVTLILVVLAYFLKLGVLAILGAYLIGKALAGISISILAFRQMNRSLGSGWWRASLREVPGWRGILGFAINTNLNGTVNLITRDNIPLYLGALSPAASAQDFTGYFKLGLSLINFVILPIDPFIWPTYAEITRTIAQKQWQATRTLLKRVSSIAGTWTLAATAGIALLGWWLIPIVFGPNTSPVYPLTLILLIGYGIANIINWNRPLLLALGKPAYPLLIAVGVGAIEILLILWLVPARGYLTMAAILSGYLAFSICLTAWRGWQEIRVHEAKDVLLVEPTAKDIQV